MTSIRLILLLVLCVHLTTSAAILAKRDTPAQKEEAVKQFNQLRVAAAKKAEISNMHELTYDYELEKVANSMTANCNFPSGDYMLVSSVDLKSLLKQLMNKDPNFNKDVAKAVFHPLQTKVACVDLPAPCPSAGIEERFCLFGPHTGPPSADAEMGPLGAHCDHGVADNGLCKVPRAEKPVVNYEKTTPGNVEEKGAETKAATQMNSMILAGVFAIVMIFA